MGAVGIEALSVKFYRGIGSKPVLLCGLSDLNIFIGPNNAGKSTVLRLLAEDAPWTKSSHSVDETLAHRGEVTGNFEARVGVQKTHYKSVIEDIVNQIPRGVVPSVLVESILNCFGEEVIWFDFVGAAGRSSFQFDRLQIRLDRVRDIQLFRRLFGSYPGFTGGSDKSYIEGVYSKLADELKPAAPRCVLVPAIRSVGSKGTKLVDFSGDGLIDRLAELQSPDHHQRDEYDLFQKVNALVQFVMGRPDARIEVPHHREHINVHIDDKVLPLSSLGTGVQQLIMIGAFCCMNDDGIICLEEPETHLHPAMQKKLFHFLRKETSAQYFVATHSPAIIDMEGTSVFHVQNDGACTQIRLASGANDKFNACHNLGYRASDIAQANFVLWVEGPSDRVYLVSWLSEVAPELREGLHYTIMFYGGRLLSHLSADDQEVTGFINLLSLGRRVGIIIDSDKKSSGAKINKTKQRVIDEFSNINAFNMVTACREIENYIPFAKFEDAVKSVHKSIQLCMPSNERYDDYFATTKTGKIEKAKIDKVKVAEVLCKEAVEELNFGLAKRIKELAEQISKANAIE